MATVISALRHPRGRYVAERASQLSGIPRSTLYDWRRADVYLADFPGSEPMAWSYRDLGYLRLLGWLRQLGMDRPRAADNVRHVKSLVAGGGTVRYLRADREALFLDNERESRFSGVNLLPFDSFFDLLSTFDLLEPVEELRERGRYRWWAPDLVTPSDHTLISPWVLAGDPCLRGTRIPTSAIHALRSDRGLTSSEIIALYPGLTSEAADDAYILERRLRGFDLPAPAAA